MPSADEPASSSLGYQEKLPGANIYDHRLGHDATSIIPRWAPAIPEVQSLSSPLARMAESIYACCNFGWQHPVGYQSLPSPTAVVYDPPQQYTMEALPHMPAQTIDPLLQHLMPGSGEFPRHTPLPNGQLNLNPSPLDSFSVLGQPSLQTLLEPLLQETSPIGNASDDAYLLNQTGVDYSSQLASSELYNFPMAPPMIPMPPVERNLMDENTSPLQYGPATLLPPTHTPLVNVETASAGVYNCYNVSPAQKLLQPALFEQGGNPSGRKQDSNLDSLASTPRSGKRGPFRDQSLREQTAQTRKMGSCMRCRIQRIRVANTESTSQCEFNSDVPGGACLTCKKVENTKAARLPCLRYKITDMTLYKPGQVPGYEWTRRWAKNTSDPIQQWASPEVKVIYISVYFSNRYLPLKVRKFVPQEGDKLERTWDYQGTKKSVEIPPYALIDLEAGKSAYTKYIRDSMTDVFRNILGNSDSLLYRTYLQAWHMWRDPATPTESFDLLNWTLRLWIAVRLSTTSAFIAGRETLGMSTDILDQTSPDPGKIPLPPVLGAQMDMILIQHIQTKLRHELLDNLQKVMLRNKPSSWLVTYLVTFILLHNVALITKHDAAYARKHGMKRRFAREGKVQEYHLGANIILAHFHYCNKGVTPFSEECEDQDLRTLAHLDEDKIQFVRATRAYVHRHKQDWEQIRAKGAFEEDYFFVSQLFEEKWQPRSTIL
ncbi:hypothetical protein Trco_000539 [Trichoderma cornu-damae]|uniref:Zn(2)-C6 fungal-type domain-containing protein n=1 Tax=Trichoderma cornu-damae TaxID=654480 RepID=A0A9P8TZ43_9HYPO|nr:hypothetical protein Trco_000539 [Trichoderma cornu-damae]